MNWRFWQQFKSEPTKKVLLFRSDGDTKIVSAKHTQSGWIARYWEHSDDKWLLLCKNGLLYPKTYVKRWLPHSGWEGTEIFPLLEDQTKEGV